MSVSRIPSVPPEPAEIPPPVNYQHLLSLSDSTGVFEHALYSTVRPEHGYCLDDVARALVVLVREPAPTEQLDQLAETCLRFIEAAVTPDGTAHNRCSVTGEWTDIPGTGDWWGRALWALGVTTASGATPLLRHRAARAFARAAQQSSPHLHAAAFAALGSSELLRRKPGDPLARRICADLLETISPSTDAGWAWPRDRMTYGSASIAEAVLSSGTALNDPAATAAGLALTRFVISIAMRHGRLSVIGSSGRGPDDTGDQFDQQPIEVAAIADAAAAAWHHTQQPGWLNVLRLSWAWFQGDNDTHIPMLDPLTGAGFDGLEARGRNENQGAESTLAALSTWQWARQIHDTGLAA